jgi:hypothetical protein
MSKYLQDAVLNWLKGTTFPAAPGTLYLGLFTTNPADDNSAGTEVSTSGTAYVRRAVTLGSITGTDTSSAQNSADVTFPSATGAGFGTIVGAGIFSAISGGDRFMLAPLDDDKTIESGDTVEFEAGELTFTMS